MPRYVAFLRGVSPTNLKMPELMRCFEAAGFTDVRTVLPSPRGPVFMTLIEKTFGTNVTTRTWNTLSRCANA